MNSGNRAAATACSRFRSLSASWWKDGITCVGGSECQDLQESKSVCIYIYIYSFKYIYIYIRIAVEFFRGVLQLVQEEAIIGP